MIWTWDLQVTNMTLKQARLLGLYMSWFSIWFRSVSFNVLKVSQSRAIIDRFYQDEGFELTYYIETLISPVQESKNHLDAAFVKEKSSVS